MGSEWIIGGIAFAVGAAVCAGVLFIILRNKINSIPKSYSQSVSFITRYYNSLPSLLNTTKTVSFLLDTLLEYPSVSQVKLIKYDSEKISLYPDDTPLTLPKVRSTIERYLSYPDDDRFDLEPENPLFALFDAEGESVADTNAEAHIISISLMNTIFCLIIYFKKKFRAPIMRQAIGFIKNQIVISLYLNHFSLQHKDDYEFLDNVYFKGPVAMGITDLNGRLTSTNKKFSELFPENIDSMKEIIENDVFQSILQGNRFEKDIVHNKRNLKIQGFPSFSRDGSVKGFVFTIIDESIQYLLYKKLEVSENRYRMLIKKLPVGLVIMNKSGTIYFVNDNFLFSLGYAEFNKIQGREISEFFDFDKEDYRKMSLEIEKKDSLYIKLKTLSEYGERVFSVNLRKIFLGEEEYIEAVFQDISLENALYSQLSEKNKLLEDELKTARVVQEHILAIPTLYTAGVRFHSFYKPSSQLGGDFYDILPIDEIHVGIIIADVSGHGVSSSLITAMLKILVEFAPKDPHKINEMMNYLNSGLVKVMPEDHFITLFYGIIDTQNHSMEYINCGHPFPLIYDDISKETTILSKGMSYPLGSFKNLSLDDAVQKIKLPVNCKLLFFTDGLLNFKKERISLSMENLRNIFTQNIQYQTREILPHIYLDVVKNSTQFTDDDVSMLLILLNKEWQYKKLLSIPSNVMEIDIAIVRVMYEIERHIKLGDDDKWKMYTALYEAMINAVEHGNKYNVQKRVSLLYRLIKDWAVFKVRDEGPGFVVKEIPNPLAKENMLKPSGRGVFMIRKMMDKVKYNALGNELTMFMRIRGE
ncbi:MAG: hypothetical protein A2Y33_01685 [Spirochaetes bacterium GWF1_51_8]|nr:MAG: hypothetical protein A2Y33_01685 [Spirochaetes bacterium GWF1_51_8]